MKSHLLLTTTNKKNSSVSISINEEQQSNVESNKIKKLIEEENTGIEVCVKNPQLKGGSIGGFYMYDVEGQDKKGNFSIKRRYNDFHELRAKLVENWPGIFIPPLPEKKSVVGKSYSRETKALILSLTGLTGLTIS